MSRRHVRKYKDVKYVELTTDSGFEDLQFTNNNESSQQKIPWKAIMLATFLLIVGTISLSLAMLNVSGLINIKFSDGNWPMMILGLLMFIPGAYYTCIAYYAYIHVPGYSFDDIPEVE